MFEFINKMVWSDLLLFMLLGIGALISLRLKFFQILKFPYILKNTFLALFRDKNTRKSDSEGISQLQTVSSALAATMGTGNIVGVASALVIGGAGAIFWMWVSALLGMALVYAENYLGTIYKRKTRSGVTGGAPAYLEYGCGKKYLAVLFCIFCSMASLGMGNMTQINSISTAAKDAFGFPPIYTGIIAAVIILIIISGGIKRIGKTSQILIPILSIVYIGAAIIIIIKNHSEIPDSLRSVFSGAFGINAIGGGISGTVIKRSINCGLRRGVFSNEAGLGSSSLMHTATENADPHKQGMWAIFEVFADTIICCTVTAFAILTSGSLSSGKNGTALISETFASVFGRFAPTFTSVSILLFAFATIISWFYCGECCVKYIFGKKAVAFFRIIFAFCVVIGSYAKLETVWTVSDIFNGLMAFPNLAGLFLLRKEIKFRE